MDSSERFLRIREVAERTALSRSTIYELIAQGEMPSVRIGASRRVPESLLNRWMQTQVEQQIPTAA